MSDIDALRAKRLAELADQQSKSGIKGGPPSSDGQPQQSPEEAQAMREQEEEAQRGMISQILEPAARERLSRIRLVRPQRAQGVQQMLLRMAQSGQLRGRVTEPQLIDVLDQVEAAEAGKPGSNVDKPKITFSRRKGNDSDDDLDFGQARTTLSRPSDKTSRRKGAEADDDDDFDL